ILGPLSKSTWLVRAMEVRPLKFRRLHDRVVVRRLGAEQQSAGGTILPDTAEEKHPQRQVRALGRGARGEQGQVAPLHGRPGDTVLFGKWSGTEVKIDGEELLIMKESDIMGVLESQAKVKAAA